MSEANPWKRCSACKQPIAHGAMYYACNVSTCNRKRTALHFCSVSCWDVHLPVANHRESWAVEKRAPSEAEARAATRVEAKGRVANRAPRRRIAPTPALAPVPATTPSKRDAPEEVLIVASRLKDYVRARSGFNTSDRTLEPLSKIVRRACDEAIRNAERDGRKTVLDRDIP